MDSSRTNQTRLLASLVLAVLLALLGLTLRSPNGWFGNNLVRASYDTLHELAARDPATLTNSPVVIVYLDLESYLRERHDPTRPWPRDLHAQLVDRLTKAGARAVVFDIVFSGAGPNPSADKELTRTIADNGHVFLAGELNTYSQDSGTTVRGRLNRIAPPYAPLEQAAKGWGLAALAMDDDFVVRRYFARRTSDGPPSLTWAVAETLQLPVAQPLNADREANNRWVRYYAAPFSVPHHSFTAALDSTQVPDDFFRDRVVLIGARPMIELFHERKDEFGSPFRSLEDRDRFMPGVEVHATQLLNLMRGDWLSRPGPAAESGWLILAALASGLGLIWLRPMHAAAVAVLGSGLVLVASLISFNHGVWFPWLIVAGVQIPGGLAGSVLFNSLEWYRTRRRLETARRVAEARIREQAALIDKAHDAILVQDLNGKVLYANASAERLYGWNLNKLQHDGATAELFSPDAAAATLAHDTALSDGEWNGELKQQTRTGQIVTVASRWTLIRDDTGQPKALLLINSDITEKKQLEQQFLRTQRMNTIGTIAGGMAHDLNNALAPILMGVQLLKRKSEDDESGRLLGLMETNTHRSADMVRQVLLFARGRGGEFERLELGVLVKELEKMVRETFPKNIAVDAYLPGDLWPVRGNPTQLHQVLLNLCVNARDAMPNGGKLSFVADNVELSESEAAAITGAKPGQFVSLLVSDTGTGMPPEVRARIFEPFFSTKGEGRGTGIGLATVHRIVSAHAGFLRVESEPGEGTTFEVFLPRAEVKPAAEAVTPTEMPRGNGELVLIADDERAIRELMTSELASFGYRVFAAENGADLVRLFEQHADEVKLLITDNAMPVMDGAQAIANIRHLKPELPIILTSGEADQEERGLTNTAVLRKPFTLEELLSAAHRLLAGR